MSLVRHLLKFKKENTMLELKEGDACEIVDIGKGDVFHKEREDFIGQKVILKKHKGHWRDGFIRCHAELEKPLFNLSSGRPIKVIPFFVIKLKKISE